MTELITALIGLTACVYLMIQILPLAIRTRGHDRREDLKALNTTDKRISDLVSASMAQIGSDRFRQTAHQDILFNLRLKAPFKTRADLYSAVYRELQFHMTPAFLDNSRKSAF